MEVAWIGSEKVGVGVGAFLSTSCHHKGSRVGVTTVFYNFFSVNVLHLFLVCTQRTFSRKYPVNLSQTSLCCLAAELF